jgi:hypothetical protein
VSYVFIAGFSYEPRTDMLLLYRFGSVSNIYRGGCNPPTVSRRSITVLYADPGSGLLLWQVLVAAFLGVLYQVRKVVYRVIFRKRD